MRVLRDTRVLLWAVAGRLLLKRETRQLIEAADEVHVSAASIWEVAIKARLGKIDADPNALVAAIAASGFSERPVRAIHAATVAQLPMHHNDPFDRIRVAQAITGPVRLLTADAALVAYTDLVALV